MSYYSEKMSWHFTALNRNNWTAGCLYLSLCIYHVNLNWTLSFYLILLNLGKYTFTHLHLHGPTSAQSPRSPLACLASPDYPRYLVFHIFFWCFKKGCFYYYWLHDYNNLNNICWLMTNQKKYSAITTNSLPAK